MYPLQMPVSRCNFLLCFVSLCIAFVPVPFFAVFVSSVQPVSALILEIFSGRFDGVAVFMTILVLIYTGFFTTVGGLGYYIAQHLPIQAARWFLLGFLLAIPVACSFARVVTYSSFNGNSGTYTFWEAVHRYFEKHP
jgi:hypothetical protein